MVKLKHQPNEQCPELDLSDEDTLTQLLNQDVLKPVEDVENEAAEKAIKDTKPAKITLTLSAAENSQITRMAAVKNQSVKEFLLSKIQELLIEANVGQPLISSPSFLSNNATLGKKITAPTFSVKRV